VGTAGAAQRRRRVLGRLVAALVAVLLSAGPALAGAWTTTASATGWSLATPLAREQVRRGDQDTSVYHIQHVRELQVRLSRAGVYSGAIGGTFGPMTEAAVKAFQRRVGLPVTGVATHRTWRALIRRTTHLRVPSACRQGGWHMCVDRWHHEATLFHDGALYNSWLVRTGSADLPTRLGTYRVYYRDIDHVSSLYGGAMPYSQFFDGGQALHGSVLMTDPFVGHSHGCVNFYLEDARQLWNLTSAHRLVVTVHGAWN
jgi:Putative peptidoglycan binding domain/L,D-transpeptidase catalytic domain